MFAIALRLDSWILFLKEGGRELANQVPDKRTFLHWHIRHVYTDRGRLRKDPDIESGKTAGICQAKEVSQT